MKKKYSLRTWLTISVGTILFISNTLMVFLLFYNFFESLRGFQIEIGGELLEYYFDDGFEESLLVIGVILDIFFTTVGMMLTYWGLGKILKPLQELSLHMERSSTENIISEAKIESPIQEIDSLIGSFNVMSRRLKEAFMTQKEFSAYVAHEFRTPLAVMQTKIDVYRKDPEKEPEELVLHITEQIKKLTELVNCILEIAGIQKAELTDLVPVPLLIEEVMEDLEQKTMEKKIKISFEDDTAGTEEEFPCQILGNHGLLYQAFFNVIENAIKYNHLGGRIMIHILDKEENIFVYIADTGYGVDEEEKNKIFHTFYRCRSNNKEVKGHGIGLAFSKKVFEHHEGRIRLCDTDQGTCFEICLRKYKK